MQRYAVVPTGALRRAAGRPRHVTAARRAGRQGLAFCPLTPRRGLDVRQRRHDDRRQYLFVNTYSSMLVIVDAKAYYLLSNS